MTQALDKEQLLLLGLLASKVNKDAKIISGDYNNLSTNSWHKIYNEAKAHAVDLIVYDAIKEIKGLVDEEVLSSMKNSVAIDLKNNVKVSVAQKKLVDIFIENDVQYVIIKGATSSSYYDNFELRMLGDVDVLISDFDKIKVEELLIKKGYVKFGSDHPSHVCFEKDDVRIEIHFEIAGIPYGKTGEYIRKYLSFNAFKDTISKSDGLGCFNAPSDVVHGIVILLHTAHHLLGEGLGLRHLLDFACFLQKTKEESFWTEILLPFIKEVGLTVFTINLVFTVNKYLSVTLPSWCEIKSDGVEDEIILDVMSAGNFGRKDYNRASSGMLISEHGKGGTAHNATYNLSHSLHKAVLRIAIVKKCIILYPFVYFYKATKFLFLSLIGKRPSIIKMAPEAKKRKQIYDKLKVFQTENEEK